MLKWLIALSGTLASLLMVGCGSPGTPAPPPPAPTVQISVSPTSMQVGNPAILTWSSQGASSVSIDHGVGSQPPSGHVTVSPSATTTYMATVSANGKSAQASTTVTITATGSIQSVKHIVFMLQENRTFDNYFGRLNEYRAAHSLPQDVDGVPQGASNPSYDGTTSVPAFHIQTMCAENQSPSWDEEHVNANRYDAGSNTATMDGFVFVAAKLARETGLTDIDGIRVMGYYDGTDLPYYYFMASQFATSDRWFAPVMSNSMVNRIYLFAGTSAGHAYPFNTTLINMNIFEMLQNNGISWKVYLTPSGGVSDGDPEDTGNTYLNSFQPFASVHQDKIVPVSEYLSDVANGTLPAVSFIETTPGLDEHPGKNIQLGAAYGATLINALMASQSWADSVFILAWDEEGGLYDHVPPAPAVKPDDLSPIDLAGHIQGDFDRTGFRVPLLVVSPFTKPHYVSHSTADYTAILKFIETRFNLPSLTNRDAAQIDMTEFFDFAAVPWRIPPTPPAQPINGTCDYQHLQ